MIPLSKLSCEGWKERAFELYPLHEPRFPVESRGFPALHAPFLKERRTRGPVQSCVQEIGAIDGCPILRALCEGWDSHISPPDLPRKADLFLRRPGCSGQDPSARRTQVSKARPGPPTQNLEVAALFSREHPVEIVPRPPVRICAYSAAISRGLRSPSG